MVAADKLKLEFEEVVDDSHDSDENPDAEPDDHGESNPSTLDEYLMGHESSDDDEENAKAAEFLLRLKSGNEHKELKRVWKKEGRRWYARRATWIWALILVAMGCLIALGVVRMTDGGFTRAFQAWRLAFFLATCPLCWIGAKILTFLTIKIVEKTVITRPSALYIVYAIRRSLLLLLASVLVLIAWACWQFIENTQSSAVTTVMMWILRAMGIVSLFLLGQLLKKMLAKMLLTILTGTNQRERMESALQQEKLLGKLMAPRPLEIDSLRAPGGRLKERPVVDVHVVSNSDVESTPTSPTRRGEKIRETVSKFSSLASGFLTGDDEDGEDDAGKRKRKRVTPLRRAQQLERLNRLEKYLRKRNLHVTLHDQLNQVEDVAVDSSTYQRLGQFLFFHLTHDVDAKEVTRDDIKVFVRKDKEVDAAFAMLDHNGDGTIDCDDCIQALERVYFDRNNLANTLRDSRSINGVVELLLGALIHIILFFVYLLILQANVRELWLGFSGMLVAFSFVFASTVSGAFENAIFVFGVHAYDVGDVLYIDGSQLTVDEINLNFTVCVSGFDQRVYYPNQQMLGTKFVNLSKSLNKWEIIFIYVDANTSPEILLKIEEECTRVRLVEHKGEYGPGWRCKFAGSEPPFKVGLEMVYEYSHNGTNFQRTACARSWMYEAFFRVLVENNVEYTWPKTVGGLYGQDSSVGGRGFVATNVQAP